MIRRTGVSLACASLAVAALLGPMGTSASAVPVAAAFLDPVAATPIPAAAEPAGGSPLQAALAGVPGLLAASAQVPVSSDSDSAVTTATGEVAVDVPRDPARAVQMTGEAGLSLSLDLPQAPQTADAAAVADGVVGFTGSAAQTDTAVQVLPDGARVLTVIHGASAPYRFAFPMQLAPGGRLEPDGDGFTVVDAQDQTLGRVDPAWAVDARGRTVPASYELSGTTLTLVVAHAGMSYPVVADPSVSSGGSPDAGGGKQLSGQGASGGGTGLGCDRAVHAVRNTACQGGSVNSRTGEFVLSTADVGRPGRGVSFSMGRVYNSGDTTAGVMGPGWTHSYDASLSIATTGNVTLKGEDGRSIVYTKQTDGTFTGPAVSRSTLEATGTGYTLTRRDRIKYDFTTTGTLRQIRDHNTDKNRLVLNRNPDGTIASVSEPAMGRVHPFTYNATTGLLETVSTADGRTVTYGYTGGRLTSVTDVRKFVSSFGYTNGKITTVTDARRNVVLTNTYGADGRVDTQTDPYGHVTTFGWNATSLTATMTDAKGKVFTDDYAGNNLVSRDTPLVPPTLFEYHPNGALKSKTDPAGNKVSHTTDANGNRTGSTADAGLATESTSKATYNSDNTLATSTDAGNTAAAVYDYTNGNLTKRTNADGSFASFGRDPAGSGLLTSSTNEDSQTTTYGYGKAADGTSNNGELESVTSPLSDTVTMTYDPAGRMNSTTDARGNVAGASTATKDAHTSTTGYDDAGNVTSRTSAGNTSEPKTTTTHIYDENSNKTSTTDANGNTTTYTYDKLNRLETVTGPDGAVTRYGYDSVGNLDTRTVKNVVSGVARDQVTRYGYNADRQLSSVTTPLGDQFTYTYTKAGDLEQTVDAEGNATAATGDGTTTYAYNTQNQLEKITYADGTPTVTYTYFPSGDRKTMTDGAGSVESYEYWPNTSRLKTVRRDGNVTFTYTYTAGGSVKTRTAQPGNLTTSYTYDSNGLMKTVTAGGAVTTYDYFPGGRLRSTTLPNGYVETRDYQLNGRLDYVANAKAGVVLSKAEYTYDKVGNPTRVVTEDETVHYTYNKRDMLTLACYSGATCDTAGATTSNYYKYSYDRAGNRITKDHAVGGVNETTTYTYNADDEITLKDGPSGPCIYEHDRNGNQTNQCGLRFTYNDANQMTTATKDGGTAVQTYTYDGDSKRLTTGNGTNVTTRYQWDTNSKLPQLAAERGASNGLLRSYTHGLDTISMTTPSAGTFYYHYDGLGSVTDVTSSTGAQQSEYKYEAFGDLRQDRNVSGAPDNRLKYTGEYLDTFTDTYHLRARQYDSHLGRFTQTDPQAADIKDPFVAQYVYVGNSPTRYVDPSGRFFDDPTDYASLIIGLTVSLFPALSAPAIATALLAAGVDIVFALNDDDDCDAAQIGLIAVEFLLTIAGVSVILDLAGYTFSQYAAEAAEILILEGLAPC